MANTYGKIFRITTFGESHGGGVGVIVDGCPPRLPIDVEAIQSQLDRRRPGQSHLTTARAEADQVEILSGVFEGLSLGSPIMLLVRNKDARSDDYSSFKDIYRPSHADFTYDAKYGIRNWKGGGRTSARETIGRVAGGAVAFAALRELVGAVDVVAWVESVQDLRADDDAFDPETVTEKEIDANLVRCPDPKAAKAIQARIEEVKADGDSVGGVIRCVARGIPAGLGEPVFERLEADLAKAMLSIPAVRGFEIGSGFGGTHLTGFEHNDPFIPGDRATSGPKRRIATSTNLSGGVQGGITNGETIDIRVAFKPTATVFKPQETVDKNGEPVTFQPKGRHDPCVLPRAVPIVEAMMSLTLADHLLMHRALTGGGE